MNDFDLPARQTEQIIQHSDRLLGISSLLCAVVLSVLLACGLVGAWMRPPL